MHEQKIKILLAEDDPNLGLLLVDILNAEEYEITLCADGEMALNTFHNNSFNLCLIDIMMPKKDGFSLARAIRLKDKNIPIIFITAKSLKEDKLKGYVTGADDYITKPFDEDELLWKIKAMVRRIPSTDQKLNSIINIGKYTFDFYNQSLSFEGKSKRITERENEILKYLYDHSNLVVRREDLLKALWGENDYFLGRSLDVFITKIRKYLKDDPTVSIENVFGVGFIFNVPKSVS
jgi:DNA-binding response OmpR family regulator